MSGSRAICLYCTEPIEPGTPRVIGLAVTNASGSNNDGKRDGSFHAACWGELRGVLKLQAAHLKASRR